MATAAQHVEQFPHGLRLSGFLRITELPGTDRLSGAGPHGEQWLMGGPVGRFEDLDLGLRVSEDLGAAADNAGPELGMCPARGAEEAGADVDPGRSGNGEAGQVVGGELVGGQASVEFGFDAR